MNRAFKLRVIDYVCEHVPRMLKLRADQTLMIDYRRVVEYVEPNRDVPTLVEVSAAFPKATQKLLKRHPNAPL